MITILFIQILYIIHKNNDYYTIHSNIIHNDYYTIHSQILYIIAHNSFKYYT